MIDIQLISIIVGIFTGIGVLIAGIGYAYSQFKIGGDKYKDNLIDTLKEALAVAEERIKKQGEERAQLLQSHQAQLTDLHTQLGILQGRFEEQGKKIEEYKMLLQGRDPQVVSTLNEIKEFMSRMAADSTINKKRNKRIDAQEKKI